MLVSGNLFRVMGVRPEVGRDFNADEDSVPGRNAVVVLGNEFWERQFGGDRSIIGRRILLDGMEFEIVGVAPKNFSGMDIVFHPDIFVPLMMWPRLARNSGAHLLDDRADRELTVKGRLKSGVPIAQARAEMHLIAENLRRAYPTTNRNQDASVRTELTLRLQTDPINATLAVILMALAGAVLLIACANVASLLLGRAGKRSREIAVRLAIGASRFRLIRLLMMESLVVALLGGLIGLAFGYGGVKFFGLLQIPTDLPIRVGIQMDNRVLTFNLAISILSAVICGLAPALHSTRTNLITALKTADVDIPGRRRLWGRNALVICQVAASLVLLTAAFQLGRTFHKKALNGPGFRTDHLFTMRFDPELVRSKETQTHAFYKELVRRARLLPGVKSAAVTSTLPMSTDQDSLSVVPEGYQMPPGREHFGVDLGVAGDGYFNTLGVEMASGRVFSETDTVDSPKVAIVNEKFADDYWPGVSALGKRFHIDNATGPLVEIVGISKTAKYDWIGEPPVEFIYLPFIQRPRSRMTLMVQSESPSSEIAQPLRDLVRNLDAGQPVFDVRTIEDFYRQRVVGPPNMIVQTVSAMGFVGLILALAGLYGLVNFSVNRRIREIGIRMAIGADAKSVLAMVLRQAVGLVAAGIGIGLLLGLVAERGLNKIFTASGTDVGSYLFILPALLVVTMIAAFIPARRASRIEPSRALRYE